MQGTDISFPPFATCVKFEFPVNFVVEMPLCISVREVKLSRQYLIFLV